MPVIEITYLFIGFAACTVGALPFGIVNLTVLDETLRKGSRTALNIAHGAAIVEVVFGLVAILTGGIIESYINDNAFINYFILGLFIVAGIVFFFNKKRIDFPDKSHFTGFLKGVFLNLISIQVFLFWIIAIAFLSTKDLGPTDSVSILIFLIGIWLGKMMVLWSYAILSKNIIAKSQKLSNNMNRIIGIILFSVAIIQVIKM